jgi:hypothetical protein
MRRMFVDLRETNKQWMPAACSVKELWEELERLLKEAEEIASILKLPLQCITTEWVSTAEWVAWLEHLITQPIFTGSFHCIVYA